MSVLACLLLGCQAPDLGRFREAEIELRGPLSALELSLGAQATTRVELDLAPLEQRTITVPLCAEPDEREPVLRELPEAEGDARWNGWTRAGHGEARARWDALPPGLRARPPVALFDAVRGREPQTAGIALATALCLAALALRRRTVLALGVSFAGSAALLGWAARAGEAPRELRVLEGDASGAWVAWDSGYEVLEASAGVPLRLEVVPESAEVLATARLGPAGIDRWRLEAPRAVLRRCEVLDAAPRRVAHDFNGWGRFEAVWVRSPEGVWSTHGPWEAGEPLPAGAPGMPPGGLNPALPQGVAVLVARLAPGTFAGGARPGGEVWLRWVGASGTELGLPR